MHQELETSAAAAGMRLDAWLAARFPGLGRRGARSMLRAGAVRVDGRRARKGERLTGAERIVLLEAPRGSRFVPQPDSQARLRVVYEDAWIVAVSKPPGVPSHPLRPDERGTLAQALLARYPEMAGIGHHPREPGLIHRLDRDTSGVLLAARDVAAFNRTWTSLRRGDVIKHYLAVVHGMPRRMGALRGWLRVDGRRARVLDRPESGAREAHTQVLRVRPLFGTDLGLVHVRANHATRHQVRAQLAAAGHPLAGDVLYGGARFEGLEGHFLHASHVAFEHPQTGARLSLRAPLPAVRRAWLRLQFHSKTAGSGRPAR